MTTGKPGSVNQKPLYHCSHCIHRHEDWLWSADYLRVHHGECWCISCWEVRQEHFPIQPSWYELEPYTPTLQEAQPEVTVSEIVKAVANYIGSLKGGPFTPAVIEASIIGQLEYGDAFIKLLTSPAPICSQQSEEVIPLEVENPKYLYGQRVIVDNDTVATFRHHENEGLVTEALWVELPDGVVQWRSPHNVKPLPGGQL